MRPHNSLSTRAIRSSGGDAVEGSDGFSEKVETEGIRVVKRLKWYFALWTGLILLLVVPWLTFMNHLSWSRVVWIPFSSPDVEGWDVVANALLYVPWGYLCARLRRDPSRLWTVVALAAGLSIATEASQVYSDSRFPSATDVTCNILGAFLGAEYARRKYPGAPFDK